MRLFAIAVDEVRDMLGADSDTAARLREIASAAFAEPAAEKRPKLGLLGRIGPLFKHPIDPPQIDLDQPLAADVENLLAARFVTPERLPQSWQVMLAWLSGCAWGELNLQLDPDGLDRLEFDLARAGLPSQLSPRSLCRNDPQLPLRAAPQMSVGWCTNAHAMAAKIGLSEVIDLVEEGSAESARQLLDFLANFEQWSQQAPDQSREAPDLFVVDGQLVG